MRFLLISFGLILLSVTVYSCEKSDDSIIDYYHELYENEHNGKTYIEVVLDDTSYVFKNSDINRMSTIENNQIEQNRCCFSGLKLNTKGQSGVVIGDTVILFNTGGSAIATSLMTGESTSFLPECTKYNPHCNVANYYSYSGKHYVYLSEWDGQHRCFVEELWYDSAAHKWNSKLRQILSLDIDDSIRGVGNMDWIIDQEHNMVYVQTYKDGTSENATGLVYLQFPLPSPRSSNEIIFKDDQIIRRIENPMIYISQDKFIYKNKMYIASGWGGNVPGKLTVINLINFSEEETYDLSFKNDEPEGIVMYKDNILLFYWGNNYSIQNKPSLFLLFNNGLVLSYPKSKIREIKFL